LKTYPYSHRTAEAIVSQQQIFQSFEGRLQRIKHQLEQKHPEVPTPSLRADLGRQMKVLYRKIGKVSIMHGEAHAKNVTFSDRIFDSSQETAT